MMLLTYILTLLTPFLWGGDAIIYSKLSQGKFFSKGYTSVLKGICCLIVIYVHVHNNYQNPLQDAIGSFAYVCVTLFFLISAYGMMLNVERKQDYLHNFWKNRLVALLIPCALVNIVNFLFNSFQGSFIWNVLYHLNGYVWVLIQFCIWFYIVEICKKKWFADKTHFDDVLLIGGVVVSSLYMYIFVNEDGWCFERIGLVWGILLYRYFDFIVEWMNNNRFIKSIVICILSMMLGVLYLKYKSVWLLGGYFLKILLGLFIIILIFVITSNREFRSKISLWLGGISYEVYLCHGITMGCLEFYFPSLSSGWYILLTVVFTLVLSTLIHSMCKPIVRLLRN